MSAAEQFHVSEIFPSYWRVTFDNGPVNLLDPDTVDQFGSTVVEVPGSHSVYLSQPQAVADLISTAARSLT